jgi:ABC-type glycerol-3-phosphate transport system permease component
VGSTSPIVIRRSGSGPASDRVPVPTPAQAYRAHLQRTTRLQSFALSTFLAAQTVNLPQLFIAASIVILPLVVMFVFIQRWIVEGVERSGISE